MYIYIYIFMHACVSIYEQIRAFRKHTQYLNTYVHMHIHMYSHACIPTLPRTSQQAGCHHTLQAFTHIHVCIYIYIYLYTYIHAGTTNAQLMQARSRGRKHRLLLEHLRHEVDDMAPVVVGVLPGPDNMWIQCTS